MRNAVLAVMMCVMVASNQSRAGAVAPPGEGVNLAHGIDRFALELYPRLPAGENAFFSPASISTAFAMAYAGARGATAEQIAQVMHFTAPPQQIGLDVAALLKGWNAQANEDRGFNLAVANALWGQRGYPFAPAFTQLLESDFAASLHPADFAQPEPARQTINQWVQQQTQGKIQDLIPKGGVTAATRLVLTNAVYFKAAWDEPFNKGATRPAHFKLSGEKTGADVPMMHNTAGFHHLKADGFAALEMPYARGRLSMIVLLPDAPDGLAALEKNLTYAKLSDWLQKLQSQRPAQVAVSFPRFKMTRELQLGKTLAEMGMAGAFGPTADFSGMSEPGAEPLGISEAFHKAFIDVNEEGTEAAAATGLVMRATAAHAITATFNADHPFLFLIRDNQAGAILFMGRVVYPAT